MAASSPMTWDWGELLRRLSRILQVACIVHGMCFVAGQNMHNLGCAGEQEDIAGDCTAVDSAAERA